MLLGRRRQTVMPQKGLDRQYIHSTFQQMSGKTVAQTMEAAAIGQPGFLQGEAKTQLRRAMGQRPGGVHGTRKKPDFRPIESPIGAQLLLKSVRKEGVSVFLSFGLHHPDLAATTQ